MRRLPSGTRISPPWPIAVLNALGGPLKAAGLFPKVGDERKFRAVETACGSVIAPDPWVGEARRCRTKSYDEDADLSLFGVLAIRSQMLKAYKNAIDFEHVIERHPEILAEKIERPLFVLGWPRTGTTMMQRLLSLHKDARYTPVWEGISPLPDCDGQPISLQKRKRAAERALKLLHWVAPDLGAIHPMGLEDPDECYHLFRNYSAMPPGWDFAYLPGYWTWFARQSDEKAYELHKRQLQILQWYDRRGHWVLKSPQHMAGLPGLLKVYQDARIVFTHRDPVEAVASYCSLVAVAWGMTSDRVDRKKVVDYVLTSARDAKRISDRALKILPSDQVVHVEYRDMMRNAPATASAIYDRFGYPRDADLEDKMRAWMAANPKDRHGRHTYSLADFGLSESDVRRALDEPAAAEPRLQESERTAWEQSAASHV